jgi:hypothetical protein
VNTKYATYYCRDCSYIAHLNCSNHFEEKMADKSLLHSVKEMIIGAGEKEIVRFFAKRRGT